MGLSIDLGDTLKIVEIISILAGGGVVLVRIGRMTERFNGLGDDITKLNASVLVLNEVVTKIAVQSSRLDNQADRMGRLEKQFDDLRRGKGFVQEEIDGEYGPTGHRR